MRRAKGTGSIIRQPGGRYRALVRIGSGRVELGSFATPAEAEAVLSATVTDGAPRNGSGLYFVQSTGGGPIKIGYADNVAQRLLQLQVAHWQELTLLAIDRGARPIHERHVHRQFEHLRVRGEWFWPAADLCRYVDAVRRADSAREVAHG